MALIYGFERGRICREGVGAAVFDGVVSVCEIPSGAWDSASEIDGTGEKAILLIKRWLPNKESVVVGDSSFAAIDLLNSVRDEVTLVSRVADSMRHYIGKHVRVAQDRMDLPRKKGKRLPTLQAVSENRGTKWKSWRVKNWYGEVSRKIEIKSGRCVWYDVGKEAVPIRWVIIRDPLGEFETQALLCTRVEATPKQIVEWFVKRWQVEVTFEESRRHLGIETQRQWSDKAIARTTPCLYGMFSLITLVAEEMGKSGKLKIRQSAWYEKELATFSDAIGCVRQSLWEQRSFQTSPNQTDTIKIPRPFLECLTETLCFVT